MSPILTISSDLLDQPTKTQNTNIVRVEVCFTKIFQFSSAPWSPVIFWPYYECEKHEWRKIHFPARFWNIWPNGIIFHQPTAAFLMSMTTHHGWKTAGRWSLVGGFNPFQKYSSNWESYPIFGWKFQVATTHDFPNISRNFPGISLK